MSKQKTIYAFKELKKNHHKIFIASGRMPDLLDEELYSLNPNGFILGNGAYCLYEDKVISENFVSKDICLLAIDYCKKHNGSYFFEYPEYMSTNDLSSPAYQRLYKLWKPVRDAKTIFEDYNKEPNLIILAFEFNQDLDIFYEEYKDQINIIRHSNGFSCGINPLALIKDMVLKR